MTQKRAVTPRQRSQPGAGRRRAARSAALATGGAGLAALLAVAWALTPTLPEGRIALGVRIGGQSVGGYPPNQAAAAVNRAALRALGAVSLQIPALDREFSVAPQALGLRPDGRGAAATGMAIGRDENPLVAAWERWQARRGRYDVPVPWLLARHACRRFLSELAGKVAQPAENASARWNGSKVVILPARRGVALDVADSLQRVAVWNAQGRQGPLRLAVKITRPQVDEAALAPVDAVIARYTTRVAGSSNRLQNVRLAARAIDGVVIMPGARFSYNQVVGPRTSEAGYKTAPVIVRGRMVRGVGGGACQVSSTLYNAALLANLAIVRRTPHSHPIGYVPDGRDATVVYGAIDLVLENRGDTPVVLQSELRNRRLTIMVLGKGGGPSVQVYSSSYRVSPGPPLEKPDPALAPGTRVLERESASGVRAVVVRVVGKGAAARREVISRDFYPPTRAIYRVGPALPAEPAPPLPESEE